MNQEMPKAYEPKDIEQRWYPFWQEHRLFEADPLSDKPKYCMVLPPPNVTGSLHLGHALTATLQDALARYHRMRGFEVLWLPGTDHAGIATQMMVEKELQKTEQKTRQQLGREEFLKRVWQWKEKYGARISEQHQRLGASLDWSRERFTMDEGVSRAVKEVFVRLYEQGLLYRAQRLIHWDPQLKTALSDLEVENEERDGSLWHIAYPVVDSDEKLVVATTRPETMLGDTAVAVHPEDARFRHLIGKRCQLPLTGRSIPIIGDAQLVSMEFGTGAVKVTPAHDHNDYQTGVRHQLEIISIFDEAAAVNSNGADYAGLDRFEARKRVVADLEALGLLVKIEPYKVTLPISQRSGSVVEPRLSPQWFVKTAPLAEKAIAAVESGRTTFVPAPWTNTFYSWMRNIHDWCVSRQLWWGHRIPAWYDGNGPKMVDGSLDFSVAKPVVARDNPGPTAENPSGNWVQDHDVLDTWFSSALWPFSTLGWPEQTAELKAFYPNAVMETGHDIIFFWVARMMMMGIHFMGEVPFRTVYLHAMVRDEKGEKMSKTKGNVIDPLDIIAGAPLASLPKSIQNKVPKDDSGQNMPALGADALRFTLASLTQQGRDIKLAVERVAGYRAFVNKLWNASRFALLNLEQFSLTPERDVLSYSLSLADRWILSRLSQVADNVNAAFASYQFADAASALYQFLWAEFCDWYIELSKSALYGDDPVKKEATQATLLTCLDTILRLLHPLMPFVTEEIWQRLPIKRDTVSISQAHYPFAMSAIRDSAAEAEMRPLIEVIEGIRTIRGESNLSPALKLVAEVQSDNARIVASLNNWKHYVLPLCGLSALQVNPLGKKPALAAADIRAELEVYVPLSGVVDLTEERERLSKEIDRALNEAQSIDKRLDNPQFVARAPAEVVEKDRSRANDLKQRAQKLNENLRRLSVEQTMSTSLENEDKAAPAEKPRKPLTKKSPSRKKTSVKKVQRKRTETLSRGKQTLPSKSKRKKNVQAKAKKKAPVKAKTVKAKPAAAKKAVKAKAPAKKAAPAKKKAAAKSKK
jgi:valyl-tRNA synthetase